MKMDELNIVLTGANGALASFLLEYFAACSAFVVGTVRQLVEPAKPKNNVAIIEMDPLDHYSIDEALLWINSEAGDIHVWINIIGGFTMGNHVEEGHDDWAYMYNTNFITTLNCCQKILPHMKKMDGGELLILVHSGQSMGCPLLVPTVQARPLYTA